MVSSTLILRLVMCQDMKLSSGFVSGHSNHSEYFFSTSRSNSIDWISSVRPLELFKFSSSHVTTGFQRLIQSVFVPCHCNYFEFSSFQLTIVSYSLLLLGFFTGHRNSSSSETTIGFHRLCQQVCFSDHDNYSNSCVTIGIHACF